MIKIHPDHRSLLWVLAIKGLCIYLFVTCVYVKPKIDAQTMAQHVLGTS